MIFVSNQECPLFKKAIMNGKINEYFQYSNQWSYLYIEELEVTPGARFPEIIVYTSTVTGRRKKQKVPVSWVSSWVLDVASINILVLLPIGFDDGEKLIKIVFNRQEYKGHYEHMFVTQN